MIAAVDSRTVVIRDRGPNLLLRALWFVLLGLWLGGIWATLSWIVSVTVIGLPLGVWMLHRLPLVTTLYSGHEELAVTADGRIFGLDVPQRPFLLRALWFLLVGWWASAVWLAVAFGLAATWIGMPLTFWMINRTPAVLTLTRS